MTDVREIPEAIQWHEGMLLAPQHFQQLALRHEALVQYHAYTTAPFYWGVRRLTIDQALLVSGTLRVLELEAIMPDGLIVAHGLRNGRDESALEVDLTPYADEMTHQPLPVHLAVVASTQGAVAANGVLPRYESIEGDPVTDANTGDGELRIPRLHPHLSLLAMDTPPQKYVAFPLVHVRYENEAFVQTDFLAPTLTVPLRSPLGDMCTLIAKRLREKALFLFDKVRTPSVTMGAPLVLETKMLIQSLVSALPPFEAVLSAGVAHPYTLYLALCSLVGHVSAVGASLVPPALDAYNHNDLRPTFEQAKTLIFRALDEGIQEAYTPIPFQLDGPTFHLPFERDWMDRLLVLGVRGQTGMAEREVVAWMETCLIGSSTQMPSLQERRVLGAARLRIDGDADLVPGRGVVLFALEADATCIEPDAILQIFKPPERSGELRPAEIVLYVKNQP
ncbi:MAG: type VI secretion system baseplate subunit TssK [Candidatus Tectomicrobia bacterium]|nr:type VI secretion system baseplate subunit TssK [Candidatus Tectomicrobia bacterium]